MALPTALPASALSIQGEQRRAKLGLGILCRASWRHVDWDGQVYVRTIQGVTYWVAVLECTHCGTVRITRYEPQTWAQVGSHRYEYLPEYPRDVSQDDCRAQWLNSLVKVWEDDV